MSRIDNLSQPNFRDILRRIHALENAAPMNNAAVGRSGFEVYDGGTINVSSGNIIGAGIFSWQGSFSQSGSTTLSGATTIAGPTGITGKLTVQGATDVTGPFNVTGVTKLNGPTTVGADLEIVAGGLFKAGQSVINPDGSAKFGLFDIAANGNLSSKGTLEIDGVTTLKNDLNVVTGGKIKAGSLEIEPANGGQINFDGGSIAAGALGMLINNVTKLSLAAPSVILQSTSGVSLSAGAVSFNVTGGGFRFTGAPTTTSGTPNVHMSADGVIFRKI